MHNEIIEESYNRCGVRTNSGYDLKRARRNLNILFSEWGNRGIHLWKTELNEIPLVSGQAEYAVDADVNDVLEAYVSSSAAAAMSVQQTCSTARTDSAGPRPEPYQPSMHHHMVNRACHMRLHCPTIRSRFS